MATTHRSSRHLLLAAAAALAVIAPAVAASAAPVGVPPSGAGGQLAAWGNDDIGETDVPATLLGKTVTAVAAGNDFSLALTSDGVVTGWGQQVFGAADPPSTLDGKTVIAIAAGEDHALALTSDGVVTQFGVDPFGESGVPTSLEGVPVTLIAAGGLHNIAVSSTGRPYVWGYRYSNVIPASLRNKQVIAVAAGHEDTLAVTDDGVVTEWNSTGATIPVPAALAGQRVTAVAAGSDNLALTSGGAVVQWGGSATVPASLAGKTVVAIAAGFYGTDVALTSDGVLTAWGTDSFREADVPASLTGKDITAVAAGGGFILAITPDAGDFVAPVLTPQTQYVRVSPTSQSGAVVRYVAPTALDDHDGVLPVTCQGPPSGSVFPRGFTAIVCTATDAAGNVGHATINIYVRDASLRAGVTGVSPASGPAAGGTTVVLTGYGFTGATRVSFGGRQQGVTAAPSFTVDSDTQITAVTPPHAPQFVHVYVSGPSGNSGASEVNRFHYLPGRPTAR